MDFYKNPNKNIDIFFIFERRINESSKGKNKKGLIDSIGSFKRINYLYFYLINQFYYQKFVNYARF